MNRGNKRFAGVRRFAGKSKYLLYTAAAAALALPAKVFGQESGNTLDMSAAEDAADDIGSALKDLITGKILTNVVLVAGAGLVVWGVFLVIKYVRRGGK